jgi:hypothetical protein
MRRGPLALTLALTLVLAAPHAYAEPPAARTPAPAAAPALAAARASTPSPVPASVAPTATTSGVPAPPPAIPPATPAAPPDADIASAPMIGPPPSMTVAVARVGLALVVVSALLIGGLAGYRWVLAALRPPARGAGGSGRRGWFARWILPGNDTDRIDVLARSWVGAKESVCLIRTGQDRFLIGVTAQRVSLLGRLDESGAPARAGETASAARVNVVAPAAVVTRGEAAAAPAPAPKAAAAPTPDFAHELASATPAEPPAAPRITEASIRAALAESRQRRARSRGRVRPEVHVA